MKLLSASLFHKCNQQNYIDIRNLFFKIYWCMIKMIYFVNENVRGYFLRCEIMTALRTIKRRILKYLHVLRGVGKSNFSKFCFRLRDNQY